MIAVPRDARQKLTGIGGALYAHFITFLTPDSFGILHSIDLLLLGTADGVKTLKR